MSLLHLIACVCSLKHVCTISLFDLYIEVDSLCISVHISHCSHICLFYASCFWIEITGSEHCSYTSVFHDFVYKSQFFGIVHEDGPVSSDAFIHILITYIFGVR